MAVSIVIDITQNSQNIANNTSNVTVKVNAKWTGGSYNTLQKPGSCTIDGTKYTFTSPFNTGQTTSGSSNLFTKTLNISHSSDGTKTLAVSASYTSGVSSGTVAASASKALTTIPRKSTLSVANGTLGTSQTLTVTRQSTSFTHTVSWTCGTDSGNILTKSTSTSFVYMPGLALAKHNTSGTSVSIKFVITTYNGDTSIGSNSYTKSFAIPASVKPSCTISVSDAMGYKDTYGGFVQNKSKFAVTVTPTLAYESPIKSYSISANGAKYTKESFATGLLSSSGNLSVSGTVTDNRNRTSDAYTVKNLTVLPYASPNISLFNVKRVNIEDLAPNPNGEYILVTFSATASALNNLNNVSYKIEYKKTSDSSYSEGVKEDLSALNNNYDVTLEKYVYPVSNSKSYNVRLTVTDNFGSVQQAVTVSTKSVFISQKGEGKGIAFGKAAEEEGAAEFGFIVRGTHGEFISSPLMLLEGTDLNDLLTEGHYIVGNTATSATILNKPFWYANTNSTASIVVTRAGDGIQKIQRYYPCVKGEQFEFQRIYYGNAWSDWMITGGCTEWKNLTVSSGFEVYTPNGTEPRYRVNGNIVSLFGAVKPTEAITSNTTGIAFATGIPTQFRPTYNQQFVCQGSGINRWLLAVTTGGALSVARYGTSEYVNMTAGTWLTFTVSYSL